MTMAHHRSSHVLMWIKEGENSEAKQRELNRLINQYRRLRGHTCFSIGAHMAIEYLYGRTLENKLLRVDATEIGKMYGLLGRIWQSITSLCSLSDPQQTKTMIVSFIEGGISRQISRSLMRSSLPMIALAKVRLGQNGIVGTNRGSLLYHSNASSALESLAKAVGKLLIDDSKDFIRALCSDIAEWMTLDPIPQQLTDSFKTLNRTRFRRSIELLEYRLEAFNVICNSVRFRIAMLQLCPDSIVVQLMSEVILSVGDLIEDRLKACSESPSGLPSFCSSARGDEPLADKFKQCSGIKKESSAKAPAFRGRYLSPSSGETNADKRTAPPTQNVVSSSNTHHPESLKPSKQDAFAARRANARDQVNQVQEMHVRQPDADTPSEGVLVSELDCSEKHYAISSGSSENAWKDLEKAKKELESSESELSVIEEQLIRGHHQIRKAKDILDAAIHAQLKITKTAEIARRRHRMCMDRLTQAHTHVRSAVQRRESLEHP